MLNMAANMAVNIVGGIIDGDPTSLVDMAGNALSAVGGDALS